MLIKLSYESILFYICKHHWITLYEVLIGPLRFQWLQWQTVKHILRFLCPAMSLIQRISCFVPVAFFSVFFTFYITAAPRSPTQRSGLWCFRRYINKELNQTFKVSKHFTFYEEIFHYNNYSLCCIIFLAVLQQFWPLRRWSAFQSCRHPSASSEHHLSSYMPLLTFSFPKSALGKKAVPLDYIWKKMYHRRGLVQTKIRCLPKLTANWSQSLNHYLFQKRKLDFNSSKSAKLSDSTLINPKRTWLKSQ